MAGVPARHDKFGLDFVTSSTWDPVAEQFGAFPLIFGTLISSVVALAIAVPLSLGVAIYLSEFAPKSVRQPVAFLIGRAVCIAPSAAAHHQRRSWPAPFTISHSGRPRAWSSRKVVRPRFHCFSCRPSGDGGSTRPGSRKSLGSPPV